MKFIYIKTKEAIKDQIPTILDVFGESINIIKYNTLNDKVLVIYYDHSNVDLKDVTNIFLSDLYIDLVIYESKLYKTIKKLEEDLLIVDEIISNTYFKNNYINNQVIVDNANNIDDKLKKLVFGSYYNNNEMILTVKEFLENNQNITEAAKKLYLHRNTLTQRLDKFIIETEFNVREFIDGYLIYKMIK